MGSSEQSTRLLRHAWVRDLPFFYGWAIVFLAGFSMFATTPGQSDSFGIFFNFFVNEFGWSRTYVSSLYAAATLSSGVLMFFVGRLVDRFGSRFMAILSAATLGVACMLLSFVVSPAMLFGGFFLARLTGKGALDLSTKTLAPNWFLSRRALAIMLVGLGGTLGGMVFPLLNTLLIQTFGWRMAYRFLAGGLWLLYIPVAFIFMINRPEFVGMKPYTQSKVEGRGADVSEADAEPEFRQSQAIRTSAFWILTYVVFQSSLVGTGVILHFVSILETRGFSLTFAAAIMGVKPLVSLITTVLAGMILDRVGKYRIILAATCFMQMLAFALLAFLRHPSMAYAYAILGGMANGIAVICIGVLKPNLFGRRYLGGILGVTAALNVIGSAIGPILFGAAYDLRGGYTEIILLSALLPLIAGVLCFFIRRPSGDRLVENSL